MIDLSEEAIAAISGGRVILAGSVKLSFNDTWRFWSGVGTLAMPDGDYIGVNAPTVLTPMASEIGGAASGVRISVSGLDPAIAAAIEDESYHQKPAVCSCLIFAPDGFTLIQPRVLTRGRVDTVLLRETVGGKSTIEMMIEGPGRDLARSGARIRSDTDQRTLMGGADGFFKHVSVAGEVTLHWGRAPAEAPRARNPAVPLSILMGLPGGAVAAGLMGRR